MFTKLASFAAAALIVATVAPPAHAGIMTNGKKVNGVEFNGKKANGVEFNGQKSNGRNFQGTSTGTTSFAIDGIELPRDAR